MTTESAPTVTLDEFTAARSRIAAQIHRTPMIPAPLSLVSCRLHLKLELFQKTGSFKIRGVLNKLSQLTSQQKKRGVLGVSSGNHAQSLAYGARLAATPATIVMPSWSEPGKVQATRDYGGEVVMTEGNLLEACRRLIDQRGLTMVHPFDDPAVIAGAGTLGLEILEDVPQPDVVFVSIGGGGLISGVAGALKQSRPETRIVGVEPEGAAVMTKSLRLGKVATLEKVETIADGLAAPFAGVHTLAHVKRWVDEIVVVSDREIVKAMKLLLEKGKVLAEPAAAAALAPLLCGKIELAPDATAVGVVCGGNINLQRLKQFI